MPVYSSEKAQKTSSVENEWVKVRLGDVCEIYQPETISKEEMCSNGAFPVFGANGKIGYYDRYNHEEPEVLVCCRGATCGTVNMSEPCSWITGNAMVVHPKDERLNQSFLYYLLMGGVSLHKCITGSAQPQITKANLTPVKIPLPPLHEQQEIVDFLTTLDQKLDIHRRKRACLENIFRLFLPNLTRGTLRFTELPEGCF